MGEVAGRAAGRWGRLRRRVALQDQRLRQLPHVQAGERDGKGRPRSRQAGAVREAGREAAQRVRQPVDLGPERLHPAGLQAQRDAELQLLQSAGCGSRAVSDRKRGVGWPRSHTGTSTQR